MRQFWILVRDILLNSFKTKRAFVFLLLYIGVFALLANLFVKIQDRIGEEFAQQNIDPMTKDIMIGFAKNVLKAKNTDNVVDYLLSVPFFNIAIFFITILGTPFLIIIIKSNTISQEVYDKTIRFLTFRISRARIYTAKFLSSFIEIAVLTLIAMFLAVIWAKMEIPNFNFAKSIKIGFDFWLIAQIFLLVFTSYTLMISTIFNNPAVSLSVCYTGLIVMMFIAAKTDYLSPVDSVYIRGLFYGPSPELFISIVGFLAFSAIFFFAGFFVFERKDL